MRRGRVIWLATAGGMTGLLGGLASTMAALGIIWAAVALAALALAPAALVAAGWALSYREGAAQARQRLANQAYVIPQAGKPRDEALERLHPGPEGYTPSGLASLEHYWERNR